MVIYKITNLLNEKIYIGQTKQPIEKRFLQHSKANSPLGQAMRECGLENFTIEIVERCKNQNELNEREKFWIKVLRSKSPNGYNLSNGGEGLRLSFEKKSEITLTGKRLKALREAREWSQADVASQIGVGRTTYLKYENGENKPVRKLNELANLFNVSIDYLLGNEKQSAKIEPQLGKDETRLLNGYRALDDAKRQTLFSMLAFLNSSQGASVGNIVQNNTGNNSFLGR